MNSDEFRTWAVGKYSDAEVAEILKFASKTDLLAIKTWYENNNG